jgi:hypothetical protein
MFQMEGDRIYTLPTIARKFLIDPQITSLKAFDEFHCPKDWIQPKTRIWTISGQLSLMKQTSL